MPENATYKPGPDIDFPGEAGSKTYWAGVCATDSIGVSVSGLRQGDVIEIHSISGQCSFAGGDRERGDKVLSMVDVVGAFTPDAWDTALKAIRSAIPILKGDLKRDGYGKEGGDTSYAKKEGGIIICMPAAGGTLDSNPDTRPEVKDGYGRLPKDDATWKFPIRFPITVHSNRYTVEGCGVLNIAAFDHDFQDNAGVYEVVFSVTRKS